MPTWFYNRPLEKADPTEAKVAEVFNELPKGWYIRWGYFYERKSVAGLRDKEGDFILLGPDKRILVVEVKGGQNRHFALSGVWEHGEDNPATQLNDEWKAVIFDLREHFEGKVPYVGKALCLPHVNLTEQDRLQGELGRECLIFGQDLKDFTSWWAQYVASHATHCKDPVKAFHASIARGLKPESLRMFLKQSDRLFDQFKATKFEILSMLKNNRHWIVEGGVGTGKTFLALKQAEWLAEQGEGRRVLFLVYNLLLAERLTKMVARLKLSKGSVEVRSWEALLAEVIAVEDLQLEVPTDLETLKDYYQEELPGYVRLALAGGKPLPRFDALVVDEAQDHDTAFDAKSEEAVGWWSWYFALLKEGTEASVAIFYDKAQRPAFRGADKFDVDHLRAALGGAVHVKLEKALRYTQPIFLYLKQLRSEATKHLVDAIQAHDQLPVGPEVVELNCPPEDTRELVEQIVQDWKSKGLCKPSDVALIGPRKWLKDSSLGDDVKVCGYEVADYNEDLMGSVSYIGAHRSKGMDFLAVIIIDFAPFEELSADSKHVDVQEAYFMGASRARQLLGVISVNV